MSARDGEITAFVKTDGSQAPFPERIICTEENHSPGPSHWASLWTSMTQH